MKLQVKPMGDYQTNCYIVSIDEKDFIIDPGIGATNWVIESVTNPVAIFNTHGHFDHVWSNAELQDRLKVPLYIPKDDLFMLTMKDGNMNVPPSKPDVLVEQDEKIIIDGNGL